MRSIKFRAWDAVHNRMIGWDGMQLWMMGSLEKDNIMQYTGLKDKNGTEIYEGDITKNERGEVGVIVFRQGRFVSEYISPHNWDPMEPIDGLLEKQEVIGCRTGTCFGNDVPDTTMPMVCQYFLNDVKVLSVFVYLNNGISIYNKAIFQDISTQMDPQMISSFLEAISMFGKELTKEDISQIQFQKMNILICRGNQAYGALLVKGNVDDEAKEIFSDFVLKVEGQFPDYFTKDFNGICLPEDEVDKIAFSSMREYIVKKLYKISPELIENHCNLKCALQPENEGMTDLLAYPGFDLTGYLKEALKGHTLAYFCFRA